MFSEDNEMLEGLYEELNRSTRKNIELIKLIKTYHRMVMDCEDLSDAKIWAQNMVDHTVLVIENDEL